MNHSWKGEPEKPWAGLTFNWPVYFFIGFHDFTCACVHFLGFCNFIGLSHLKQGHQVHRTIGNFENEQSEGRSPDWNRAQTTLEGTPIGGVQDAAYDPNGLLCH